MDMVAAAELTSVLRMRHYGQGRSGWAGVGQVRAALDLASEHSRSRTRHGCGWSGGCSTPACPSRR